MLLFPLLSMKDIFFHLWMTCWIEKSVTGYVLIKSLSLSLCSAKSSAPVLTLIALVIWIYGLLSKWRPYITIAWFLDVEYNKIFVGKSCIEERWQRYFLNGCVLFGLLYDVWWSFLLFRSHTLNFFMLFYCFL